VGMFVGGWEQNPSRMMGKDDVITDHETILNNPPDILMTNYKMLDYLLVRPKDAPLWKDNGPSTLKYIAVDELHTFDGAQGTDLACLIRRLKARLLTPPEYVCCIGTSATMGSKYDDESILRYASDIFDEAFLKDALITEERLSPSEFFAGFEAADFTIPTNEQVNSLRNEAVMEDEGKYVIAASKAWLESVPSDVTSNEGKIQLGNILMRHGFMQAMVSFMKGDYYQASAIAEALSVRYPELKKLDDPEDAINALVSLVSYARTGSPEHPRPFLQVSVQLWVRELRRLVANVSKETPTYSIVHDLNAQQSKQYLPVVNCRDCGATGWASILNERHNATMMNLDVFYNSFFKGEDRIVMMFPSKDNEAPKDFSVAWLCPECLSLKLGENVAGTCVHCGTEMVRVLVPNPLRATGHESHKQFTCPFCGSTRGMSLVGLRSTSESSVSISEIFASKFNDDKKTLAFSDNVQDAAHHAGFFNARTWRFGFRNAMQRYAKNGGSGKTLAEFTEGFLKYWHQEMDDESFVSFFIAPNMTWMEAYEEMVHKRSLGRDKKAKALISDIEKRISYEIMLEYGISSRIGRSLVKSGCSCLAFDPDQILGVAKIVQERVVNELGAMPDTSGERYAQMVALYLDVMRQNGAFNDGVFSSFINGGGNPYLLANDHVRWMPGMQSRTTPRFLCKERNASSGRKANFDATSDKKYVECVSSCCEDLLVDSSTYSLASQIILEELAKSGIVVGISGQACDVYALDKGHVYVTDEVLRLKCDKCGSVRFVAKSDSAFWEGAPCERSVCGGSLKAREREDADYYGKLYSAGDIVRVNAKEHTSLLEREEREALEEDFKRGRSEQKVWDPNVLSCTPTLEMGIDIGNLSTVIMCNMPPSETQFLQRAGRAGRRDGNALTLVVASARPHDLYFYANPLDMIQGYVQPPKIFLKASAVLERQFIAYCMDSWVRQEATEQSVPKNVGAILGKLKSHPKDVFPFNFLHYVQNNLTALQNSFINLFSKHLDESAEKELRQFAKGKGLEQSPMHMRILESFEFLRKQRDSLSSSIRQLKALVKEIEDKPQDSSNDKEIKELKAEQKAIANVYKELNGKDVFNYLSDEGLLPNYAFPEAGVILKAVVYRKDEEDEDKWQERGKYSKSVYEYSRSASSAISEFAPNNTFYAGGRKFSIDQIDVTSSQAAKWRLCPNCSHAEMEEAGRNTASCPQCGSPAWADAGQVRNMLKVQMVYSTLKDTEGLISDDSDDRASKFYCKHLYVDVNEDSDIASAYQMDNDEFAFGYEFVKKATLREINFGESDTVGDRMSVSGTEEVRKGFKVCRHCGKIQPDNGKAIHASYCKAKKMSLPDSETFEDCLFLYREFSTEALRILIPATTLDSTRVRAESFTASFMLGMKEYFGNVDHLRATVSEVPVQNAEYRKQYLVIYDSVPGGTGYLKQLMNEEASLVDILEKALSKLENCSCKDDPQKDGCYHCLYAYRQGNDMGDVSRGAAIRMLRTILGGKENLKKIARLADVPVNSLFDSELERRFIEALAQMRNEHRKVEISKAMVSGKEGYILKVNDKSWEIEPQVLLNSTDGVCVTCKPDFVIRPIGKTSGKLPVAVFTDGFTFHKDKVADDTLKREAIRRSGKYHVWSLSWRDVQAVFEPQGDYYTPTLAYNKMPSGTSMYQRSINGTKGEKLKIGDMSPMELLMRYLEMDDAESVFGAHARGFSLSLLYPMNRRTAAEFRKWDAVTENVVSQTHYTDDGFEPDGTIFGTWVPRDENSHLCMYAGVLKDNLRVNRNAPVSVCAILDDRNDLRTDKYEEEWNGFLQFSNVMQFDEKFIAVSYTGLANQSYYKLSNIDGAEESVDEIPEAWNEVKELLFDDESKAILDACRTHGLPVPEDVGYELVDEAGEVVAELEIVWVSKKIGYMTEDQKINMESAKALGWRIFTMREEIDGAFKEE